MHYVEKPHSTGEVTKLSLKIDVLHVNRDLPQGLEEDWRDLDRWEDEGGRFLGTRKAYDLLLLLCLNV